MIFTLSSHHPNTYTVLAFSLLLFLIGCGDQSDEKGSWTDAYDYTVLSEAPRPKVSTRPIYEHCSDGLDNDGNGFTDCNDISCVHHIACIPPDEACEDGEDNDRDGFTDCEDRDCADEIVCNAYEIALCEKLCTHLTECEESARSCDGRALRIYTRRCAESCLETSYRVWMTETPPSELCETHEEEYLSRMRCSGHCLEGVVEICDDGEDNDHNGTTDCGDSVCFEDPFCTTDTSE